MKALTLPALLLFTALAAAQQPSSPAAPKSPTQPGTDQAFPPPEKPGTQDSQVIAILRTSVTSRSTHEGAPLKAALRKAITLANGETFPKGSVITGKVTGASPHKKDKPNGALLLLFDSALLKDGSVMPLHVEITSLAPSVESETARTTLPSNNGGRIGGTGNSGGGAQLLSELGDSTGLRSNIRDSGLPGIYLRSMQGSSGALFALKEDVFLDSGTQLTLKIDAGKP